MKVGGEISKVFCEMGKSSQSSCSYLSCLASQVVAVSGENVEGPLISINTSEPPYIWYCSFSLEFLFKDVF